MKRRKLPFEESRISPRMRDRLAAGVGLLVALVVGAISGYVSCLGLNAL